MGRSKMQEARSLAEFKKAQAEPSKRGRKRKVPKDFFGAVPVEAKVSKGTPAWKKHQSTLTKARRAAPPGPRPLGVLTALCAAVAATYQTEGDPLRPGVVVSCLSHDPPRYYASVTRYPHGADHKRVVLKVGDRGDATQFATAEAAVLALAKTWEAQHRPPPTRETLAALGRALR